MSSNAVFFDIIYAGEHGSCLKLPSESRITGSEKSAYHMGAGSERRPQSRSPGPSHWKTKPNKGPVLWPTMMCLHLRAGGLEKGIGMGAAVPLFNILHYLS